MRAHTPAQPSERQQKEKELEILVAQGASFLGAKQLLHPEVGLHPSMWGVSRAQFTLFLDECRAAIARGTVNNSTPNGAVPYSEKRFNNPAIVRERVRDALTRGTLCVSVWCM
jgi:hypothetical protein